MGSCLLRAKFPPLGKLMVEYLNPSSVYPQESLGGGGGRFLRVSKAELKPQARFPSRPFPRFLLAPLSLASLLKYLEVNLESSPQLMIL